jgi:hypothetical protein
MGFHQAAQQAAIQLFSPLPSVPEPIAHRKREMWPFVDSCPAAMMASRSQTELAWNQLDAIAPAWRASE